MCLFRNILYTDATWPYLINHWVETGKMSVNGWDISEQGVVCNRMVEWCDRVCQGCDRVGVTVWVSGVTVWVRGVTVWVRGVTMWV